MSFSAKAERTAEARPKLSRRRVLDVALGLADECGLDAVSMHKLGALLGVRGMSLYNHVRDKADLLDGLVELMWSEVETDTGRYPDWRAAMRGLAGSLREVVLRHPGAASLLMTRRILSESSLRVCDAHVRVMLDGGVPTECAVVLFRTVVLYGIGHALAELNYTRPGSADDEPEDEAQRIHRVSALIPDGIPDQLARVAYLVCGECDIGRHYDIGVDLMVQGLDSYVAGQQATSARSRPSGVAGP